MVSLTDPEKTETRRYCGYQIFGSGQINSTGFRYWGPYGELEFKMGNLSESEAETIRNTFLANLRTLENDIPATRSNIDTARAAVWYRNANEVRERMFLFDNWRRRLCDFLGVPYGPYLSSTGIRISP